MKWFNCGKIKMPEVGAIIQTFLNIKLDKDLS